MAVSTKSKLITLPNPHLRQQSKRVGFVTAEMQDVISAMKEATLDWEADRPHEVGVALAAVQIDKPHRIIIIRNNFDDKKDKTFSVFINPEITKREGPLEEDYEGCLSVTDLYGKVRRYAKVRMRALDEQGRTVRVKAEGFLARVLQHEVDHCKGVMFVDHIEGQRDAFYKINDKGKLEKVDYDSVKKAAIFR